MGRNLVEGHLNETVGLFGGHAIDWNGDGDAIDVDTSGDINDDGDTMDTWHDYDNWDALVFSGPRLNGAHGN